MALTGGSGWNQDAGTGEIEFALKHFYLPGMEEQKNNARVLLANVQRNSKDVSGDYAYVPVTLGRNWGIGMRANRTALPDAGAQVGARAQIQMKYAFGRLMVTLHAMAATRNSQGSYDTVLDVETEGLMEDLPKDINRQLFLDGTGRIGTLNGDPGAASTTVVLDNAGLSHTNPAEYTKYIEVGQKIEFIVSGTGAVVAGGTRQVASITSGTTFEVDVNVDNALADNDWVVLAGNYGLEVTGLHAMVSAAGIYQGINRATAANARWKANVITATGQDISEDLLQQGWTACEKASGMTPTIIICSYDARDKYASQLMADRRFVNTKTYSGGFSGLDFRGIGLVPDPECPRGNIYGLNLPYISIYQQAGLQFMDDDGAILSRVANYAAYESILYWFFELGTRRSNVHFKIAGTNQ